MRTPRRTAVLLAVVAIAVALLVTPVFAKGPPEGKGPGGETETAVNNLSFPALAADGYAIAPVTETTFTVPYAGDYPGLTEAQIAELEATGPWYPQKTDGNKWQAEYQSVEATSVTFVNWGDNIESVNPKVRRPFRLEVSLFKQLEVPMTAYTMAELEYPSSSTELQGTNTVTVDSDYATIVSSKPTLVLQYIEDYDPLDLTWDGSQWVDATDETVSVPPLSDVAFAVELNVGGKYIYGASEGGWKPALAGAYRLTFYIPSTSGVTLDANTYVGNWPIAATTEADEGGVATPVIEPDLNLTYVDVEVVAGGGGGGRP